MIADQNRVDTPRARALRYADLGWWIFPCKGKAPLTANGFKDASNDRAQIEEWWAQYPDAEIGWVPGHSGHVVIDLDVPKNGGGDGRANFMEIAGFEPHGTELVASTPSGGTHLVYRLPPDRRYGMANLKHLGIDVRCFGGYVILPSGRAGREWNAGDPDECDAGEAPSWLVSWLDTSVGPLRGTGMPRAYGKMAPAGTATEARYAEVRSALFAVEATLGRDEWYRLICAAHHALDGDDRGADLVEKWSSQARAYDEGTGEGQYRAGEAYRIYASATAAQMRFGQGQMAVTANSLFHEARKRGWAWKLPMDVMRTVSVSMPATADTGASSANRGAGAQHEPMPSSVPALGSRHGGKLVLDPATTLPTAEAWLRERCSHEGGDTLICLAETFFEWRAGRWREKEEASIRNGLQPWLHDAITVKLKPDGDSMRLHCKPFPCNDATIGSAVQAIRDRIHLPAATELPAWLSTRPGDPPAKDLLPCATALLHLPTRAVIPATPRYLSLNGIDFDYDPAAPEPATWLNFLDQLFGTDVEAIQLLQEFIGYALTPDTSQQKALLIVGPPRAGKGTIASVMSQLVGLGNSCFPTISSLAGPFGLQPLIGKSLAIISDARFTGKDAATVTERLLNITGEDRITIDRKHLSSVTLKLSTRITYMANELPAFGDASTALGKRFLPVQLTKSFEGKEDTRLKEKLAGELPGILRWALDGLDRLHARGRFVMPASSAECVEQLNKLSSQVTVFLEDCCERGPGYSVYVDALFGVWRKWCESEGIERPGTKQHFGKQLKAADPTLRLRKDSNGKRFYEGLRIVRRSPDELD